MDAGLKQTSRRAVLAPSACTAQREARRGLARSAGPLCEGGGARASSCCLAASARGWGAAAPGAGWQGRGGLEQGVPGLWL